MENTEGFVSVRREKVYELDTIRTPNFLGLNHNAGFWNSSNYGKGVIIGILDSGITPGHPSFSDEGLPRREPDPADEHGHGTHISSTAGGNFVRGNSSVFGVAPLAHVAMYRVCGDRDCPASAGNRGPSSYTVSNSAPWVLTVGASTIDRKLAATVVLGDGQKLGGKRCPSRLTSHPLIWHWFFLAPQILLLPKGEIVMCERGGPIATAAKYEKKADGAAMILMNGVSAGYSFNLVANQTLPMLQPSFKDADKIKTYIKRISAPTAKIMFDHHAPFVASFSSRGPNKQNRGILKPDINELGSNILAAWIRNAGQYNITSGTSISCPHLSGVAALLKSTHPDWSPAAVKSVIMTTADRVNRGGQPIEDQNHLAADPYSIGSGHVNNPGLVYDLKPVKIMD
ncbi:hypothetical protein SASPL_143146 [Salvia splendens]|uniref:Peptidase S8/S53 domain-containing protein n=1 Tax=Salvia splendens TaxID=180675 RepID=A0A8X8WLG6_SALSN|nr:hypothetical protein SASPL_143146 [Salvia splendens]